MVKPTTIRLILSLAVSKGWQVKQLDVSNAFLHGSLEEDVFMQQPQGFIHPLFLDYVCKLQKSIYGLKKTPHRWFKFLVVALQ